MSTPTTIDWLTTDFGDGHVFPFAEDENANITGYAGRGLRLDAPPSVDPAVPVSKGNVGAREQEGTTVSNEYMRLAKPPEWCIQYPTCSACEVSLEHWTDYGWLCPSCGTEWPENASDGETGELRDDLTGHVVPNDDAWRFAHPDLPPHERERHIAAHLDLKQAAS